MPHPRLWKQLFLTVIIKYSLNLRFWKIHTHTCTHSSTLSNNVISSEASIHPLWNSTLLSTRDSTPHLFISPQASNTIQHIAHLFAYSPEGLGPCLLPASPAVAHWQTLNYLLSDDPQPFPWETLRCDHPVSIIQTSQITKVLSPSSLWGILTLCTILGKPIRVSALPKSRSSSSPWPSQPTALAQGYKS